MAASPVERKGRKTATLRSSIKPGTVLILLAGLHKGKRVVFLKQLASGLLLVSGPYHINGVPLRRVNQAYVIATSTSVDIASVQVPEHVNDAYFARGKEGKKGQQTIEEFFGDNKGKKTLTLTAERKADQKSIDAGIISSIKKTPLLDQYLKTKFNLDKSQKIHELKF